MDDQWIYPSESQADAAAQLDALQRSQDELWVELRNEDDPDRRMALLSEFGHNRGAIEALTRQLASGVAPSSGPDDGPVSYRVELTDGRHDDPDGLGGRPPAAATGPAAVRSELVATDRGADDPDRLDSCALDGDDLAVSDVAVGDLADGDLAVGDLAVSDLAVGDLAVGDLAVGDLADGDLADGDGEEAAADDADLDETGLETGPLDGGRRIGSALDQPTVAKSRVVGSTPPGSVPDDDWSDVRPEPLGPRSHAAMDGAGFVGGEPEDAALGDPTITGAALDAAGEHPPPERGERLAAAPGQAASDGSGLDDPDTVDPPDHDAAGASRHRHRSREVKPLSFDDSGELVELDDRALAAFLVPDQPVHRPMNGSSGARRDGGGLRAAGLGRPRSGGGFPPQPTGLPGPRGPLGDLPRNSHDDADGERPARPVSGGRRPGPVPPIRGRGDEPADRYGIGRGPDGPRRPRPRATPPSRGRGPVPGPAATSQYPAVRGPRPAPRAEAASGKPRRGLLLLGGLAAVLAAAWLFLGRESGDPPTDATSEVASDADGQPPAGPGADAAVDEILAMLRANGLDTIGAERRGEVIFLTGSVPTAADRDIAIGLATGVAAGPIDGSELVTLESAARADPASNPRAAALQNELRRVVASTPLIFGVGETAITDLHARILNSIASIMTAYPELPVTVVGFTDTSGSATGNRQISLARAESVKAYLVAQGVPDANLAIDARGEDVASGSEAIANLERRVEFEVSGAEAAAAGTTAEKIRIAIVAPSARNDLAFTQSMVDAVGVIAAERGNVEVAITDNTFVPEDAAAAIRDYATQDYDLVIAHGSQFGTGLVEIAPEFPDVAFAWGTASDTFGLPNVYAYDAAAGQGGFVMGAMSTLLSQSGVVGVVGPIEVGDAQLYVNGFRDGALSSKPDATVLVSYTGSFSDLALAAEVARSQVSSGADVMTGSAQMVVGAVSVANETGALWFGNQANQTSLAPSLVVASQVYHWEVILRQIVDDIDAGTQAGGSYTADLANGGLVIEYNPDYPLPDAARQRADEVTAGIVAGSIVVPGG